MLKFIKKLVLFRIGQKTSRGVAKKLGLHGFANLAGIIGGLRTVRKHS
jgi:hypothetical protein